MYRAAPLETITWSARLPQLVCIYAVISVVYCREIAAIISRLSASARRRQSHCQWFAVAS